MGMTVHKRGRTTALTHGSIDGVSLSVLIDYGDGIGVRTLTNQVNIRPDTEQNPLFSDHGDSGSVIMDDFGLIVGLLFAGADDGSSVANPIAAVLSELNISVCFVGGHGVLTTLPGVVGVSGYFGPDEGVHHVIAATNDGNVHELYWQGGGQPGHGVLTTLSGVFGVSGYFGPNDGFHHVIAATNDGNIHEIYHKPG
jgi:hypothetical protein